MDAALTTLIRRRRTAAEGSPGSGPTRLEKISGPEWLIHRLKTSGEVGGMELEEVEAVVPHSRREWVTVPSAGVPPVPFTWHEPGYLPSPPPLSYTPHFYPVQNIHHGPF